MRSLSFKPFGLKISALLLALILFVGQTAMAAAPGGINGEAGLRRLIETASDGDVLLVDDISFESVSDPITISKSMTIRSCKDHGTSVWTGASFILDGSAGEISVTFENITFVSDGDAAMIMDEFWETDPDLMPAMTMQGNVNAALTGCVFRNYVGLAGANISAVYDDSDAKLSLTAKNCSFLGSAVCLRGGAVLLIGREGSDNIHFSAEDCAFTGNMSSNRKAALGGGAIYAENADLALTRCSFISNEASHQYLSADPDAAGAADPEQPADYADYTDQTKGGAIYATGCSLLMNGCEVCLNSASLGGGLALVNTKLTFLNGILAGNRAESSVLQEGLEGLAAGTGLGGGLYIAADQTVSADFINSSFYGNSAFSAYGGVALDGAGSGSQPYTVTLTMCTYADNVATTAYDKPEPERAEGVSDADYEKAVEKALAEAAWKEVPGNIWDTQLIRARASLVIDESFSSLKRNRVAYPFYEQPSLINNFVYFAAPENAMADGYMPVVPSAEFTHVAATESYCAAFPLEEGLAKEVFSPYYDEVLGSFYPADNASGGLDVELYVDDAAWQAIEADGTIPELPIPEKDGYHFDAWLNEDGSPYTAGATYITGPEKQTLKAKTTLLPNTYTLHFHSEAGTQDIPQVYGEPVTLPAASEKKNYDFVRWYKSDGTPAADGEIYTILGDSSYTAQYTKQFPTTVVAILGGAIVLIALYLIITRIVEASKIAKAKREVEKAEEEARAEEEAKKKAEEEKAKAAAVPEDGEKAPAPESKEASDAAQKEEAAPAEPAEASEDAALKEAAGISEDAEDAADDLSAAIRLENAAVAEAAAAEESIKGLAEAMEEAADDAAEELPKSTDSDAVIKAFAEAAAEINKQLKD